MHLSTTRRTNFQDRFKQHEKQHYAIIEIEFF